MAATMRSPGNVAIVKLYSCQKMGFPIAGPMVASRAKSENKFPTSSKEIDLERRDLEQSIYCFQ